MRRAGYEVRVLAEEGSSFEQNPPTLVEFIRRDLRWCQGNMQYWHFLRMPGLQPVSRYQLDLRHPDVPRLAGLDRAVADRHAGGRAGADAGRFHAMGRGHRASRPRAGDVVCAQYRDRDRRADAARSCAACSAAEFASARASLHDDRLRRAGRTDHVGRATRCSSRAFCSAAPSTGARRRATITRCRGRSPCGTSGRRP